MSDTTTTVAEQSEQPAVTRPVSRLRRALVWFAVVGVVAVGALGLAASDLATAPVRGGNAARFVPADGTAMLVTAGDGTRTVHENARDTGPSLLLELPSNAASHFFGDFTDGELRTAQLWRESVTALDDGTPQTSTLYLLDDRGVSMLASLGGTVGFSYSPSLVMLPADAAPGVTWSGEGDAMPAGLLRYTMTGEITAGADGCLVATTDTRYLERDSGSELVAIAETATWCPGRGVVVDEGDVSGQAVSFVSEELSETGGVAREGVDTEAAVRDWATASGWRAHELSFQVSDPVYGESAQGLPFDGLAGSVGDGAFVASLGSRLAGYTLDGTLATRRWVASPGGDLLELTTIGEVTLVSTSERRLLAYDDEGVRLWSMRFPDVVLAPPTAVAGGDVVAVSVDGTLRRIDLATGEQLWSTTLRTDVETAPAVGGGLVVVVDRGGAVLARALDDGTARWETELPAAERAAIGGGVVAVQGATAEVWALDPRDGSRRWDGEHHGVSRRLLVVDGVVVSQSDEGTAAWAADGDGTTIWTAGGSEALLAGDGRVVLVDGDSVELRTLAGEVLERAEIGAAGLGVVRMYLPTAHGLLVLQSNTTGIEVRG